jgi:hypothetical protein
MNEPLLALLEIFCSRVPAARALASGSDELRRLFIAWAEYLAQRDDGIKLLREHALAESERLWAAAHFSIYEPKADGGLRHLWVPRDRTAWQ